ncbi:CobW family GTP-binding protein [Clostridium sp. LP20]|uniref:CobW family GTP-binding protein n=1 Tax=Clostridium sp. LP20 TaxID=3418665 RepID=UPI003EE462C6
MKIDIVSGFLGAGKTTLIKKLISEVSKEDKIAIIENEFGEVSIDGDLLKDANIDIKEISSGCICCSIAGDFKQSIKDIIKGYHPTRLIIEPSGVAKVTEVIESCREVGKTYNASINYIFTVVDIINFDMYVNNFGEFYKDQISNAKTIVLTRVQDIDSKLVEKATQKIRENNKYATIIAVPLNMMDGSDIVKIAEGDFIKTIEKRLSMVEKSSISKRMVNTTKHNAHNIFDTLGIETTKLYSELALKRIFERIKETDEFGNILRGKGLVKTESGGWVEFHYTPGQFNIKSTNNKGLGKIAIIGEKLDKSKLKYLFN